MKTNAPEKIYVQLPSRKWIGRTWNETPIKEGDNPNWKNATNIEYIRKDTFIEKAIEYVITHISDMHTLGVSAKMDECIIKDYRKYMEEK